MRIYPIRTSRNKWIINIYGSHQCNPGCETIIINRGDYIDVTLNPFFINNKCNLSNLIEKSIIQLYDFDKNNPMCENGPLLNPDEVVIPDKSFTLNIDFPLSYALNIEIHSSRHFTRRDLIYSIKCLYKFIYDEEERTATPQMYKLNKICSNCNLKNIDNCCEEIKNEDDCTICYNTLQEDSIKLRCSHMFHKSCINQWIKTSPTCPICRTNIFICNNCNGTGVIFYYFSGIVIPLEERGDQINRNSSNGIFGIHSYDFESLMITEMMYDRIKKLLNLNIKAVI